MAKHGALWRVTYRVDDRYRDIDVRAERLADAKRKVRVRLPYCGRIVGGGLSAANLDEPGDWEAAS